MSNRIEGTFSIDVWDAKDAFDDRDGIQLAQVQVTKTFAGGLVGTSVTTLVTVVAGETPLAYVGVERFVGTLDGREGGFVLQHQAGGKDGEPWMTWKIAEGTGTGGLKGITGEGQIIIDGDAHSYTLDYDLT